MTNATTITTTTETRGASHREQTVVEVRNGASKRMAVLFQVPGETAHGVAFNGLTTDAPASRALCGKQWKTLAGAVAAARRWVEKAALLLALLALPRLGQSEAHERRRRMRG